MSVQVFSTFEEDETIVPRQKNLEPPLICRIHPFFSLSPPLFFSSLRMESKGKGRREQQQQHKKLLAAMLSQDSFDSALHGGVSSVAEEEMEDEDDAMELLGKLSSSRHACPWPGSYPAIISAPEKKQNIGKDKLASDKWPPLVRTPIRMFQCPSGPRGAAVWRRQEIHVFLSWVWTAFALVSKKGFRSSGSHLLMNGVLEVVLQKGIIVKDPNNSKNRQQSVAVKLNFSEEPLPAVACSAAAAARFRAGSPTAPYLRHSVNSEPAARRGHF